jgi:HEAT repeat protein
VKLRSTRAATLAAVALAALSSAPSPARAQPYGYDDEDYDPGPQNVVQGPRAGTSFKQLMGPQVGAHLLQSELPAEVSRGIERLASMGTPEALTSLVSSLDQGGRVSRDPAARLTAVRALARHAHRDNVRQYLVRELTAGVETTPSLVGMSSMIRKTAALALARSGDGRALSILIGTLPQRGPAGEAAALALRTYPVQSLDTVLESTLQKKRPSKELALLLGELGDLRATERLRGLLGETEPLPRAHALVALARLGDESVREPSRGWLDLKGPKLTAPATPEPAKKEVGKDQKPAPSWAPVTSPELMVAACEALVLLDAPEAKGAIAKLLATPALVDAALRLARQMPSPEVAALFKDSFQKPGALTQSQRAQVIALFGASGGEGVVGMLDQLLAEARTRPFDVVGAEGHAAALALAKLSVPAATAKLAKLLEVTSGDRAATPLGLLALRAGVVHALVTGSRPEGLEARLTQQLGATKVGAQKVGAQKVAGQTIAAPSAPRETAAFGLVALGLRDVSDMVALACPGAFDQAQAGPGAKASPRGPCDAVLLSAVARGALARGTDAVAELLPVLEWADRVEPERGAASAIAVAAGVALLAYPKGGLVATSRLLDWAEQGGPLAPLAARALATRDEPSRRPRIKRLLAGSDPVVRAHVALGLAYSLERDAVGLLEQAYRVEDDDLVRRALVRALSRRREPQRVAPLTVARDLDPDAGVRGLAQSALAGQARDRAASLAHLVAWVRAEGDVRGGPLVGRLVRSDGLSIPVVAEADGGLLVPGLAPGLGSLSLEPAPARQP